MATWDKGNFGVVGERMFFVQSEETFATGDVLHASVTILAFCAPSGYFRFFARILIPNFELCTSFSLEPRRAK